MLGKGGFGTVFAVDEGRLGALGHSGKVAVKRMDDGNMQGVHQLQNEIDILALCRHEHLLPLLGFCLDEQASCLVYPLMAGGSLEDVLAPGSSTPLPISSTIPLSLSSNRKSPQPWLPNQPLAWERIWVGSRQMKWDT